MGKLATVGLASAVFSPWMNISGSILANYWRRHPVEKGNDNIIQNHDKLTDRIAVNLDLAELKKSNVNYL